MILQVEASRADQGGVEGLIRVGRRDHQNAVGGLESVHLVQHGRDVAVVFLINTGPRVVAAFANAVELINEDDAGLVAAGFAEEQLDLHRAEGHQRALEVRAFGGDELHAALLSQCAGEEGLAVSRRAFKDHALDRTDAVLFGFGGRFHVIDDRHQVALDILHAGDILKLHAGMADDLEGVQIGGEQLPEAEKDQPDEEQVEDRVEDGVQAGVFIGMVRDRDAFQQQLFLEAVAARVVGLILRVGIVQPVNDFIRVKIHGADGAVIQRGVEFRIRCLGTAVREQEIRPQRGKQNDTYDEW